MVALAASIAIAVYLLVPHALFRVLLGRFVPLRAFQESKAEEFTNASVTLIVIFLCSVFLVHHTPYLKSHPFPCSDNLASRRSDYQRVASAIYSEKEFRNDDAFWGALWRTLDRQGRFLTWYYLLVLLFSIGATLSMKFYGALQKNRFFSVAVRFVILPYVSQWYALLTPFLFSDKSTVVTADVLMTDQVLYRGEVVEYFLDGAGDLSGLILGSPRRFDKRAQLREREQWGTARDTADFWRDILSAKLYLVASQIVNLNLTYASPKAFEDNVRRELSRRGFNAKKYSVTVEFKQPPSGIGQNP
ncbi:MAG: hypothetical protein ABR902_09310 [Candidatus Korobacteraceae bacterium]